MEAAHRLTGIVGEHLFDNHTQFTSSLAIARQQAKNCTVRRIV